MIPPNFAQVVRDARAAGKALLDASTQFKETVAQAEKLLASMGLHANAEVLLPHGSYLSFWVHEQSALKAGASQQVGRLLVRGSRGMRSLGAVRGTLAREAVEALPDLMRKLTESARAAAADLRAHSDGIGVVLRSPDTP